MNVIPKDRRRDAAEGKKAFQSTDNRKRQKKTKEPLILKGKRGPAEK